MTLHLHGLGHFQPRNEISNRFLEDLDIGTNEEWIMERVGIGSSADLGGVAGAWVCNGPSTALATAWPLLLHSAWPTKSRPSLKSEARR